MRESLVASGLPPTKPLAPARVVLIGKGIGALKLTWKDIAMMLGACGADGLTEESSGALRERLETLTGEQATAIEAELEKKAIESEVGEGESGG
jgi:hypothetical protein